MYQGIINFPLKLSHWYLLQNSKSIYVVPVYTFFFIWPKILIQHQKPHNVSQKWMVVYDFQYEQKLLWYKNQKHSRQNGDYVYSLNLVPRCNEEMATQEVCTKNQDKCCRMSLVEQHLGFSREKRKNREE